MCPQIERVSFRETGRRFLGEGVEASWGPQLLSAKLVGDVSSRGKWMKLSRAALPLEEKEMP
jgi:hypothetical protein